MNDIGSLNHVMLRGNIGPAPQKITLPGRRYSMARLRLVTTKLRKDDQGNWQEREQWHDLFATGEIAVKVLKQVGKGTHLYVEGELQTQTWDDKKTGTKREKMFVKVSHFIVLQRGIGK